MADFTLHNFGLFSVRMKGWDNSRCQLLECGTKLNPYRAHFATKEQKIQVHQWTLYELVRTKKAIGMTHDRVTHGRSCQLS